MITRTTGTGGSALQRHAVLSSCDSALRNRVLAEGWKELLELAVYALAAALATCSGAHVCSHEESCNLVVLRLIVIPTRYTFDDDPRALPKWFQDDERRHLRAIQPITKEEVEAMKAQFRAVDARPAKKVAEAKARKRRRLMKQMEQVRQKASAIAEQPDLNARAKSRQMERLYKSAANKAKADTRKEVVVAKKGNQGSRGRYAKGKIMVDRRMLADKRGEERAQKRKGKGKGKGKSSRGPGAKGGKAAGKKTGKGRSSKR